MAETLRHAAGYNWYEVHEVLGREPSLDLGLRFGSSELGAAVDFAFDYLERRAGIAATAARVVTRHRHNVPIER